MEPFAAYWILFIKLRRRHHRSGQSWRCRSKRPCGVVMPSLRTIARPTRRGAWIARNYSCISLLQDKQTWTHRPGLQERCKSFLGLPDWIRSGYRGVGDIRPACLFPLVKSKCFLDSGVRRCCKVGHSCMRRGIDCSSIPHKMAWCSIARAIRTVARLDGLGCEIFDIPQLRFELDSMFQEQDTPPSRCCWRCGCAMSCIGLITADIHQAFEACSSSAVLPAWRRISQTFESRFSSHSFLVRRGRRELCKLRRSPIGGVVSSAAVAVVLGTAELESSGQHEDHLKLGFHFGERPVHSCVSWRRYVDDVLVGPRVLW